MSNQTSVNSVECWTIDPCLNTIPPYIAEACIDINNGFKYGMYDKWTVMDVCVITSVS